MQLPSGETTVDIHRFMHCNIILYKVNHHTERTKENKEAEEFYIIAFSRRNWMYLKHVAVCFPYAWHYCIYSSTVSLNFND